MLHTAMHLELLQTHHRGKSGSRQLSGWVRVYLASHELGSQARMAPASQASEANFFTNDDLDRGDGVVGGLLQVCSGTTAQDTAPSTAVNNSTVFGYSYWIAVLPFPDTFKQPKNLAIWCCSPNSTCRPIGEDQVVRKMPRLVGTRSGIGTDQHPVIHRIATGNWADEMDDIPIAPIAKDPDAPRRGDPGYFESLPNRESRYPSREEIPMPTRPPFNAYVGNLAFDAVEEDLEMFFSGVETTSIKVIRDHEGKPKGFGYVQFGTLDGLKEAMNRSGESFQGRNVRISVAEPPKESGRGGYGDEPSAADTATQWRRAGPLPTRDTSRQQSGGSRYESSGGSGFGSSAAAPGADVDWTAARGTKFVARTPGGEGPGGQFGGAGGFNRGPPREFGNRESREPMGLNALAETPTDWRSSRPARPQAPPSEARESFRGAPRGGFADREVGLSGEAATEESWSRGSKFKASEAPFQRSGAGFRESAARPDVEEKSDWRSGKKSTEATPSGSAEPSPQPARKQLSLLPRTNPASPTAEEASGSAKSSPFGAARAVDTAAREQEAMERAQKREEERKAQIEAAKQQRIAAAKERDAQKEAEGESKMAINAEPKRVHPSRQQQNGINLAPAVGDRPTNTNQKRESFKRDGPPAPGGPWRRPSGEQQQQQQQQHPSRSGNARQQPAQPEVDEDGFVVATGSAGRKAAAREQKAVQDQKDAASASKPKFSFAAAAGVDDFIEDAQDEDVAGGAGKAAAQEEAGVQQATAGVNAVQI
ncbi:hypothetical protein QFC19_006447 [Naganishia cerealis]|uniref:Uncharacterized protein n=1 Tax=Naganishia cerealis TaxID=610337 RepID=A0ACC2VGQ2_9TREE|nr:hypothetical protein QFC19_006447 [Naganishia cerealis]